MKTKLILLVAATLWSAQAHAQTETVESNVTITLKVHVQDPGPVVVGPNRVQSYKMKTLKNADIIQMIAAKEGIPEIDKKARLLFQQNFNAAGPSGYSFRIREPGKEDDLMVTNYFEVNENFSVAKSKTSTAKGTGSSTIMALGEFDISITGTFEGFYMKGPIKKVLKHVAAPKIPGETIYLETYTFTGVGQSLTGLGGDNEEEGYVSGSIKLSGAKIIK